MFSPGCSSEMVRPFRRGSEESHGCVSSGGCDSGSQSACPMGQATRYSLHRKPLATHRPEPESMAVRLVTRRRRRRLYAAWWRLARGGIDHEPVDLDEHEDFFRFGSESLLTDVIQRHLEASVAGSSS